MATPGPANPVQQNQMVNGQCDAIAGTYEYDSTRLEADESNLGLIRFLPITSVDVRSYNLWEKYFFRHSDVPMPTAASLGNINSFARLFTLEIVKCNRSIFLSDLSEVYQLLGQLVEGYAEGHCLLPGRGRFTIHGDSRERDPQSVAVTKNGLGQLITNNFRQQLSFANFIGVALHPENPHSETQDWLNREVANIGNIQFGFNFVGHFSDSATVKRSVELNLHIIIDWELAKANGKSGYNQVISSLQMLQADQQSAVNLAHIGLANFAHQEPEHYRLQRTSAKAFSNYLHLFGFSAGVCKKMAEGITGYANLLFLCGFFHAKKFACNNKQCNYVHSEAIRELEIKRLPS
jgi:hypothetical protein